MFHDGVCVLPLSKSAHELSCTDVNRLCFAFVSGANRKCLTESNKVEEIKKRIQVGTSKDTEVLAPLLEQVKTATAKVLTSTKPYSAVATRKRQPSSANSSLVSMQPSKKTHDSHVTFNEGCKDSAPLEIKDYEYVQPWNAGFSTKKKVRKSSKNTTIDVVGGDNTRSLYADKSGWKRQKNGEWMRDPEAEFDSESEGDS